MEQIIEADEAGCLTLPPELLGEVRPYSRFTVEVTGTKFIIEPVEAMLERQKTYEEWKKGWDQLAEEIGKVWPAGVSAADVISEMRR